MFLSTTEDRCRHGNITSSFFLASETDEALAIFQSCHPRCDGVKLNVTVSLLAEALPISCSDIGDRTCWRG